MTLRSAVESRLVSALMGLPVKAQRVIARSPLVLDGQTLATDLQVMLTLQKLARKGDLAGANVASGRAALKENAGLVGGRQPIGSVRELQVADLPASLYEPSKRSGDGLLIFFHGGGFVYGDRDSHDAPCRVLAEKSGVRVLSVEYRVGPEAPFPAAFDDAEAAVRWVHEHAAELSVDPARIGVGGDSAGGNISAYAAIAAARDGLPLAYQLLIYPCTDADRDTASLKLFGKDLYLTEESIATFNDLYVPDPDDRANERMNLLDIELPAGLAPAFVATAGFDPLRDEGEAYARHLSDAGVQVELKRYVDQIHGFLNIVGVGRTSRAGVLEIASKLRAALG